MTAAPAVARDTAHVGRGGADYRRDIQYLRALAVGLVVLYHFWPGRITGGFVGVDVFFVISGFLITAHLLSGIERTGRVGVLSFWARRVRRLLPASFATLLVAAVMVLVWLPPSLRGQALREIIASTLYVENWVLAADSIDYLNAANQPSIVQHFWSLSVEEQFYAAWPLLLLAALALAGVLARRPPRAARVVAVALAIVIVSSFIVSIVLTRDEASVAYFATTTRAWEFAAGGLVASAVSLRSGPRGAIAAPAFRWTARILGIGMVLAAGFLFTGATPFPSWTAALPVVGTALAIWAGIGTESTRARHDPIEIVGDHSYSIYLWHWPLLIVAPFVLGHALGTIEKLALLVVVFVLAMLSKRWIEDPVRRSRWLRPTGRTFVALAATTALLVGGVATAAWAAQQSISPASIATAEQIDAGIPCFGSDALAGEGCTSPFSADRVDTAWAKEDRDVYCIDLATKAQLACPLGGPEDAEHTMALVGDSHAASIGQLVLASLPPGWRLVSYLATGCPAISLDPVAVVGQKEQQRDECTDWSRRVLEDIASRDDIDAVLFTNFTSRYTTPEVPASMRLTPERIAETWVRLEATGKTVIAVRDVPETTAGDIPTCIDSSRGAYDPCTTPRADGLPADAFASAAAIAESAYIDLSDRFCDAELCHATVGDVVVYSDDNHVSRTYARTLRPALREALAEALG
ncbi:MAG: acyltransferase family protein [Protaetiibacter sp.]